MTTTTTRTDEILDGLRHGQGLLELSREHHLSREVIRKIGEAAGVASQIAGDYRAPAHIKFVRQVSEMVCQSLDDDEVFTMFALKEQFPQVSPPMLHAAIDDAELYSLLGVPDPPEKTEFSIDDIYAALRAAATFGPEDAELTGPAYDRLLKEGTITGPSRVLIIQRCGSWAGACEGAGVPFRAARREYAGFTPEDVQDWLMDYAADAMLEGDSLTFAGYSHWAKGQPGAPSGSLIKARMLVGRTWNQIRDGLILRLYRSMPGYWVRIDEQEKVEQ